MMQLKGPSILLLIFMILLILQSIGGFLQIQDYRKAVRRVHKLGNVGIGQKRGSLLNGHIVIVACDSKGIITGAEALDGIGVWSRFHPISTFLGKTLVGSSIYEFLRETENFTKKQFKQHRGYVRALEALEARLTGSELTREQEKYMAKKNGR